MDIRDQVLETAARIGMKHADLARAIGSDPGTLRKMLMNPETGKICTWKRISEALGFDLKMGPIIL